MQVVHAHFWKYPLDHSLVMSSTMAVLCCSENTISNTELAGHQNQRHFSLRSFLYRSSQQGFPPAPEWPCNDRVTFTQVQAERMHSTGCLISRATAWGIWCAQQQFSGFLWSQTILRINGSNRSSPRKNSLLHTGPGFRQPA